MGTGHVIPDELAPVIQVLSARADALLDELLEVFARVADVAEEYRRLEGVVLFLWTGPRDWDETGAIVEAETGLEVAERVLLAAMSRIQGATNRNLPYDGDGHLDLRDAVAEWRDRTDRHAP